MIKRVVVAVFGLMILLAGFFIFVQVFPPLQIRRIEHIPDGNPPKVGVVLTRNVVIGPLVIRNIRVEGARSPTAVKVMRTSGMFSLDAASREPGVEVGGLSEWAVPRADDGEGVLLAWDSGPPLPEPPCLVVEYRYLGWPLKRVQVNPPSEDRGQCSSSVAN